MKDCTPPRGTTRDLCYDRRLPPAPESIKARQGRMNINRMVVYYVYEIRGPGVCVRVVFYRCYDRIGFQVSQKIVRALRVSFVDGKQGAIVVF